MVVFACNISSLCSMNNKNPETDIGVQPEDQKNKAGIQKNKAVSHWLLLLPQSKVAILSPQILRLRLS